MLRHSVNAARTFLYLCFCISFVSSVTAQPYQPNWESLDQRPVPQWFKDAKFGIFIHWGVYAVPGYCSKGNYAEWYQNGLMNGDSARIKYHREKFGNRSYYDLANDFKAELFNPDEWAKLFEQSGAKYIVLTSKHHDGYCLWPSKDADRTWGFPWNASEVGPKRDLLGDLFKAVRKTSVHAGMYYSLYEWFNPLWKKDHKQFAIEHTWPQMKDLINTYQPDVFWTDGDWDAPAETWKSQEFLAWLYNESPVKDKIVVNDRWGSGVRFHHGGIYTPEYQPDLDFDNHYWEESRGMGFSYGYNREEDAWDYNSTQSLILQLVDKVSRGGNFLLDIGPDEHGKIPPIMQERLLQIGDWMKINGEAIYNTVRWKTASQWSEGRKDYKPKNGSGDLLLKLTIDPDPGYAVKELFFTYNEQANTLYGIFPTYPSSHQLILKNMHLPADAAITLLSLQQKLKWEQQGENVIVHLPDYDPNQFKAPYAYVIKIAQYGKFAQKPQISVTYPKNPVEPLVAMTAGEGTVIHYTTNGTEPGADAPVYTRPFTVQSTTTIKAKAFANDNTLPSLVSTEEAVKPEWLAAQTVKHLRPGIAYKYFEPVGKPSLSVVMAEQPTKEGIVPVISLQPKQRDDKFVLQFDGYLKINKAGVYTLFTESDDGSKLFIDGKEVVNNDGDHGSQEKAGKVALRKGFHRISVQYYDAGGGNELKVSIQPVNGEKQLIAANQLFY
jgi:alpha-L-fucosidase